MFFAVSVISVNFCNFVFWKSADCWKPQNKQVLHSILNNDPENDVSEEKSN